MAAVEEKGGSEHDFDSVRESLKENNSRYLSTVVSNQFLDWICNHTAENFVNK